MGRRQLDTIARCVAMLGVAFPLLLIVVSYHLGETSFLGFAFIGLTVIQLWLRPSLLEVALTVVAGAAYGVAFGSLGGSLPHSLLFRIIGILAFWGAGSVVVMAARILWSKGPDQRRRLRAFLAGMTPIVFLVYMPVVFQFIDTAVLKAFDHYLYAFDSRFGFQAAFEVGRWFAASEALSTICTVVYLGLPLAMACVYIAAPAPPDEPSLIKTFLLVGVFGPLLFHIVPAIGPIYAFTSVYPDRPPAIGPGFLSLIDTHHYATNAVPSLHTAWALLIFWRTRGSGFWVRAAPVLFLLLTELATLGLGEHYLIDLIVAVPYTVAMRAVCIGKAVDFRIRAVTFGCNIVVFAFWLALLRQGSLTNVHPALAWGLSLATVGFALWLNHVGLRPKPGRFGRINLPFSTLTPENGSFEISRLPSRSA